MIDKLIDFLIGIIDLFRFWQIVDEYERGIVLRLGRFHREIGPGLHWQIPFGVDRPLVDNVVPRTINLGEQSLTTSDGKGVVISGVVTARIHSIKKSILEVESVDQALMDACGGEISSVVSAATWDELHTGALAEKLTDVCRKRGWRWGIEIIQVQLTDLTLARSIRLWNA